MAEKKAKTTTKKTTQKKAAPKKAAAPKKTAKPKTEPKAAKTKAPVKARAKEKQPEPPKAEEVRFKNDDVEVIVHLKPACRVQLEVKLAPHLVGAARRQAIKAVGKDVEVPGFRKGKAPDNLILKRSPHAVDEKWQKFIADAGYAAAQNLAHIPVLNNNSTVNFDLKEHSKSSAHLIYTFEKEPEVPTVDPTNFSLKEVKRTKIGEKELKEAVRQMQMFYSEWNEVVDRAVKMGDFIMIDLESLETDPPTKVFSDTRFEVTEESMAEWMRALVVGKSKGDVIEGKSFPDKDATAKEKKEFGDPRKVRLTVQKIEEPKMPELNEEFAKRIGSPSIEEMKKSIKEMLEKKADEKAEKEVHDQINQYLLKSYPFELPASLIQTEKKHRIDQYFQNPQFKTNWEKMSQKQREDWGKEITEQSEEAVRLFYLSRKIVHDNNINVSQQEIQNEAIRSMQAWGPARIDPNAIPREVYALALSKVILAKAQDHIRNVSKKS